MPLSNEIKTRELIKNYLQEAVNTTKEKNLADIRLKEVFESVKSSEEATGFSLSEFKESLQAALDYEKVQSVIDKKTAAIEVVDLLKL